jgi:hypothetical protein
LSCNNKGNNSAAVWTKSSLFSFDADNWLTTGFGRGQFRLATGYILTDYAILYLADWRNTLDSIYEVLGSNLARNNYRHDWRFSRCSLVPLVECRSCFLIWPWRLPSKFF